MGVLTPDDFTASELDTWMSHALEEARSESHGDVPVGAVVIHRHSVIASRHNERELTGDPTSTLRYLHYATPQMSLATGISRSAYWSSPLSRV